MSAWDLDRIPIGTIDPADRYRRPADPGPTPPRRPVRATVTEAEITQNRDRIIAGARLERLRLAIADPVGEWDAVARVDAETAVRALRRLTAPVARPLAREPVRERRDGRDLLLRLGADPSRGRGVVRCPAHEDRRPSLSWRLADDGRTALVRCFAGCSFAAIVEAVA